MIHLNNPNFYDEYNGLKININYPVKSTEKILKLVMQIHAIRVKYGERKNVEYRNICVSNEVGCN